MLEVVIEILTKLKAEAMQAISTPPGRDAFAFGTIHGQIKALTEFENELREKISELNNNEDES